MTCSILASCLTQRLEKVWKQNQGISGLSDFSVFLKMLHQGMGCFLALSLPRLSKPSTIVVFLIRFESLLCLRYYKGYIMLSGPLWLHCSACIFQQESSRRMCCIPCLKTVPSSCIFSLLFWGQGLNWNQDRHVLCALALSGSEVSAQVSLFCGPSSSLASKVHSSNYLVHTVVCCVFVCLKINTRSTNDLWFFRHLCQASKDHKKLTRDHMCCPLRLNIRHRPGSLFFFL